MSSTNKTTNYELSQFIGTDKPAWLQDYNADMSKIDTGIHNAATTATGADGKADANTTAIGTLTNLTTDDKTSLVGAVNEVDSHADTAQNTANSANTTASGCRTDLNKFNLSSKSNLAPTVNVGVIDTTATLIQFATDTTSSIFKIYGRVIVRSLSGITGNMTLKLGETSLRPTSAYYINSGATMYALNSAGVYIAIGSRNLKIDTDGSIYLVAGTNNYVNNLQGNFDSCDIIIPPCLYFNTDFGDA